jgi:hypothetical protein
MEWEDRGSRPAQVKSYGDSTSTRKPGVMATPKIEVGESLSEDPPDKNMRPYL